MSHFFNRTIFTYIDGKTIDPIQRLCLETWKKNISQDYEIIVLTPDNIFDYIDINIFSNLNKNIPNCFLENYLASLLLNIYGGVFLSPYTMMTKKFVPEEVLLKNTKSVIFHDNQLGFVDGFIMSKKKSELTEKFIELYQDENTDKLSIANQKHFFNEIIKNLTIDELIKINCDNTGFVMEKEIYGVYGDYLYAEYYFSNSYNIEEFFKYTKGITRLKKDLMPAKYSKMEEKEFLKQDILLSNVFKEILK